MDEVISVVIFVSYIEARICVDYSLIILMHLICDLYMFFFPSILVFKTNARSINQ